MKPAAAGASIRKTARQFAIASPPWRRENWPLASIPNGRRSGATNDHGSRPNSPRQSAGPVLRSRRSSVATRALELTARGHGLPVPLDEFPDSFRERRLRLEAQKAGGFGGIGVGDGNV